MTSKIDRLASTFANHIAIGWPGSSSGAQRVLMVVYDPRDERELRRKLELFAQGARASGKTWTTLDLTRSVGEWLAEHRYKEIYFVEPDELAAGGEDRIAAALAAKVEAALAAVGRDANAILAIHGVGALYGFASVADVLSRIEHMIFGRLLVFFPGRFQGGRYRLLDARDSWDYHAVPITLQEVGDVQ